MKASEDPSDEERAAFLDSIPNHLFGQHYLFAWNRAVREFILCETMEHVADGTVFHAEILPFN